MPVLSSAAVPPVKKLSKSERDLDEKMLAILEHAERWHDIGSEPNWRRAAQLLAERGAIRERRRRSYGSLSRQISFRYGNACRPSAFD
jgi:hypothetical protein